MSVLAIGSQVQLVFRTQFSTFTPDQFSKALNERKYLEVRSQIPNPVNPQAPPVPVQSFSKEDITVLLPPAIPPNPSPVLFQILNTVNLKPYYVKEVKPMLTALKILPDIVSDASFNCTTRTPAKRKPIDRLTSMVDETFVNKVSENFPTKLMVSSIRFVSAFPFEREGGCQVVIEPLVSSPEREYYLNISYKTTKMIEFDRFINRFGNSMIRSIIEEAEGSV